MQRGTLASALAITCLFAETALADDRIIDVPFGPDLYGHSAVYVNGIFFGYDQDAQSFIATGDKLVSVSMPLQEQRANTALYWRYELWDDFAGHPNQVVARFGSFDPTLEWSNFSVTLDTPIPLTAGNRYYLGFAPDPSKTPNNPFYDEMNFVVAGWRSTSAQDLYPAGTVWAIRNPGSAGEFLMQPSTFDYSMRISMVPEPSSSLLLLLGSLAVFTLRRVSSRAAGAPPAP